MRKILVIGLLAISIVTPDLALSQEIEGDFLCLSEDGEFEGRLAFKDNGLVLIDFVPQEMVDRTPSLANKMNVPGDYEVNGDILIVSYYNGFQSHVFTFDEFSMSSPSMGFNSCVKR